MRIRRNYWLPGMLAITLPLLATADIKAQETTGTSTTGTPASATGSAFQLEPGDQLLYKTTGQIEMEGGGQSQKEPMDLLTTITVLEKNSDKLTLYASLSASEETTNGKTYTAGPRFTFELPAAGAPEQQELEKAGLIGSASPTFAVETIFAVPQKEGKTSATVTLPITNAPASGESVTTVEGENLVSVISVNEETTPVLSRRSVFNSGKKLFQTIDTSVTLALNARGLPVQFSITDNTELVEVTKLSEEKLTALKQDLESAVPIATKLRNLQMSAPSVVAAVITEMRKQLEANPNGEFSEIFAGIRDQIETGGGASRGPNAVNLKKGEAIPDFNVLTIDDKPFKLSDHKGKVVLLDFWATWCPPCILQLPHLKELYERNKDKNFVLVGISADETAEDLKKFVENEGMQWTQIFDGGDTTSTVAEQYGIVIRPTTVLIDTEGKVSAIDLYGKKLDAAVDKLLEAAPQ